jgi:hypothetical protein
MFLKEQPPLAIVGKEQYGKKIVTLLKIANGVSKETEVNKINSLRLSSS